MAKIKNKAEKKVGTTKDLKKQTIKKDEAKKGYNEQNPVQTQGAFKPDALSKK